MVIHWHRQPSINRLQRIRMITSHTWPSLGPLSRLKTYELWSSWHLTFEIQVPSASPLTFQKQYLLTSLRGNTTEVSSSSQGNEVSLSGCRRNQDWDLWMCRNCKVQTRFILPFWRSCVPQTLSYNNTKLTFIYRTLFIQERRFTTEIYTRFNHVKIKWQLVHVFFIVCIPLCYTMRF